MKIVCLQLHPVFEQVQGNIDHATEMVSKLTPENVDVLVLPEMAFTGYTFKSKEHIRPFLEDKETGPSVQWAKTQAVRLNAFVMVGYPEKRVVAEAGSEEEKEEYFNSTCLVSPKGTLVSTYSKTFLYYTDENWAQEGPGFQSTDIEGLGKVGFGICMDVNPRQFKAPFEAFEFSNFHLDQKSKLILCSMAWNKAEEESVSATTSTTNPATTTTATTTTTTTTATQSTPGSTPGEEGPNRNQKEDGNDNDSDMWEDEDNDETDADGIQDQMTQYETIQYWAVRMSPYYRQKTKPFQEAYVVIANRIGREPGACFVGSSCVLHLGKSGPKVLGVLPVNVEGLLSVEI